MAIFSDFYKGIGRSKYDHQGFDNLANVDVHSELGVAKCQLALTSESTTPNEPCISVEATTGDVYFFSTSSGKTWKRAIADATYSLVNTNANGGHLGAAYFQGKIYYATATKLGTFDLASTWTDGASTFTQTATYRPMYELNLSLFIGNGNYIAAVDSAGTFSDNALDLPTGYAVTAITGSGTDLLIGTIIGTNVQRCKAYLWDTYSSSWTIEDEIPEIGINCFINGDNITFAQCGTSGQIYYWNGSQMIKFKRIRNVTTAVKPYNSAMINGRSLFATGTKIFSIHRDGPEYPWAIVQEYTATTGTIASILGVGSQLLASTGSNIDKIGANYATVTIDTPILTGKTNKIIVDYESIGSGGAIGISTNTDAGGFVAQTTIVNTPLMQVYFDGSLGRTNFEQGRITLTPSGENNIVIRGIRLE